MDGFKPIHKVCVCVAIKAPVGLLSGRAVLRSKMKGRCPDKLRGIYKENTTVCENRQEGFRKFIEVKREKYDTFCDFRKNTLCESEQKLSSVCGKSFYCQQQQAVACAFKTQTAIKTARSPAAKRPCRSVLCNKLGSFPCTHSATLTGRTYTPSAA